jgi:hypothetical protein
MGDERRKHPRIPTDLPFRLVDGEGREESFDLQDLSESGARIRCGHAIPAMTRVQVALILPAERVGRKDDVRVDTQGVIVWSHKSDDGRYDTGVFFPDLDMPQRRIIHTFIHAHE